MTTRELLILSTGVSLGVLLMVLAALAGQITGDRAERKRAAQAATEAR